MIRDIWEKFPGKINIKQKIFLAIFVPVLLFAITYTVAYYISYKVVVTSEARTILIPSPRMSPELIRSKQRIEALLGNPDWQPPPPAPPVIKHYPAVTHHYCNPYNWRRTWYVWILFLTLCGVFEYKLFGDKKSNKEELKK